MMADEMFEELGYTKYGVVRNDEETRHVNIGYVHKDEGKIVLDIHFYDTGLLIWKDPMVQTFVNKEEVRAIVQQCRELDWLNDTADDMLKFMGYEKIEENEKIIIYERGVERIYFDKFNRSAWKREFESNAGLCDAGSLDKDELKAINKQLEELGWTL